MNIVQNPLTFFEYNEKGARSTVLAKFYPESFPHMP